MRKSISIYNHNKFAQKVEDINTNYINGLLAKPVDVTQDFVFYIVRNYHDNDELFKTIKDNNLNYDKAIYTDRSSAGYINNIDRIAKDPRIKNTTKYNELRKKAIEFIKNKVKTSQQPEAQESGPAGPPSQPGQANPTVPGAPNMLSPLEAARQMQITPEQADKYLSNITKVLQDISKDPARAKEFVTRFSSEYNYIINYMNILRSSDSKYYPKVEEYNKIISDFLPIYNNALHPTGWKPAGNSVVVTDWYTLGDQIINDIQALDRLQFTDPLHNTKLQSAKSGIQTFQDEFLNKNKGNTDISGVANKINQTIDKYNSKGVGTDTGAPKGSLRLNRLQ
jgi:hypothetical protein